MIYDALEIVDHEWQIYKALIEKYVDMEEIPESVVAVVNAENGLILDETELAVTRYVDGAVGEGQDISGMQVNTAWRQVMLSQLIVNEALMIYFNIDKERMLLSLQHTVKLFKDAHAGLLEGIDFVGLVPTLNMCTLAQMRHVTYYWGYVFLPLVDTILLTAMAPAALLVEISEKNPYLYAATLEAVHFYVDPTDDCSIKVSNAGWGKGLEMSSRVLMAIQKVARFIIQVALKVNTLDSQVLSANALVNGKRSLKFAREGSEADDLPAPPTQAISTTYGKLWTSWNTFDKLIADNIRTVTGQDFQLLVEIQKQAEVLFHGSEEILQMTEKECQTMAPGVPAHVLYVAGVQRSLFQKMSKEAALVVLGETPDAVVLDASFVYKETKLMVGSMKEFKTSHYDLIHGHGPLIPRTEEVCTLQAMKKLDDLAIPFLKLIQTVADGEHSLAHLTKVDAYQWQNGNDPLYEAATTAFHAYEYGKGDCNQQITTAEWEMHIKKMGEIRTLAFKLSKYHALVEKGVNVTWNKEHAEATLLLTQATVDHVYAGYMPWMLPAPADQATVNALLETIDDWKNMRRTIENKNISGNPLTPAEVANKSMGRRLATASSINAWAYSLYTRADAATNKAVDAAFKVDPTVPGARSNMATKQTALLEKMATEATLVSLGDPDAQEQLKKSMAEFDAAQVVLENGNGIVGEGGIARTVIPTVIIQMEKTKASWAAFKPLLNTLATGDPTTVSAAQIDAMQEAKVNVDSEVEQSEALYTTIVQTTTKSPIDILVPLPYTGRWAPGPTMEIAARVAQKIINEEQMLLPGYEIKFTFIDSKCDAEHAMRLVLENFAGSDKWVGLGGMGCSEVCSKLAIISSSMWIPTVGYECSAQYLSDTTLYPDFARLGTSPVYAKNLIEYLAKEMDFSTINILSGDPSTYRPEAEAYLNYFADSGVSASYKGVLDDDWEATKSLMAGLKTNKQRVVLYIGTETLFRRIICASKVAGQILGMTWITVGIKTRSWWTMDDPALIALEPECTGPEINKYYEDALTIAGLGEPLDVDTSNKSLGCFRDHTSASFQELLAQYMATGMGTNVNDTGITHPHDELINFAVDATCVFAKSIQSMLQKGHPMESMRSPTADIYHELLDYMKGELEFEGVSGNVKFTGNDRLGELGLWQTRGNHSELVGTVGIAGNISAGYWTGLRNSTWKPAPADEVEPAFPWIIVIAVLVSFMVLAVGCTALRSGLQAGGGDVSQVNAAATGEKKQGCCSRMCSKICSVCKRRGRGGAAGGEDTTSLRNAGNSGV